METLFNEFSQYVVNELNSSQTEKLWSEKHEKNYLICGYNNDNNILQIVYISKFNKSSNNFYLQFIVNLTLSYKVYELEDIFGEDIIFNLIVNNIVKTNEFNGIGDIHNNKLELMNRKIISHKKNGIVMFEKFNDDVHNTFNKITNYKNSDVDFITVNNFEVFFYV